MAVRDRVAEFISKLNPAIQAAGANISNKGANILQGGANVLADVGDAAFRRGGLVGGATPALSGASNILHAGSQNLLNVGPGAQTALGYGALGAGTLAAGAVGGAVSAQAKKKRNRMSGQNLATQLGVQMPPAY